MSIGVRLRWVAAVVLIATALVGTGVQAADDNSSAERAAAFTGNASGAIPGGQGGHFAFYKFQYPGDQRKVTLNLTAGPNDFNILQYVGVKVYGPSGKEWVSAGALRDVNPNASGDLVATEAGDYIAQVYNYAPDAAATVTFTLTSVGLPEQPAGRPAQSPVPAALAPAPVAVAPAPVAAAPAPAATTDNTTAAGARPFTGTADGQLGGGQGGHFQFFKVQYPGDQTRVTFNLNAQPNDFAILQYVGFKVYGPTGREYLSVGALKDATPNATGDLVTTEVGEYTIQVYNYSPNPDVVVTFQLSAVNLPPQPAAAALPAAGPAPIAVGPAPIAVAPAPIAVAPAPAAASPTPVGDISSPERAATLSPQVSSATGTLQGAPGGNFHYYKFTYPGDTRKVTINLNAGPNDFNVLQYVGFKVYGPSPGREYASANALKDANPNATADLSTSEPGIYTIQIYNYVPNAETLVNYTVSIAGL